MGTKYKRIALVSEATRLSEAAEQTAFNLAKQHGAAVHIVATVNRPSIAAQWLTKDYQDIYEKIVNDKRERLNKTAERFRDGGFRPKSTCCAASHRNRSSNWSSPNKLIWSFAI
jgi:hypothetical protein